MQLIETIEVGAGGAASIEFLDIPQDGVDLQVMLSGRYDGTNQAGAYLQFNGSTSGYTTRYIRGDGSSVSSATSTAFGIYIDRTIPGTTYTSNTFNNAACYISNYTSSVAKSVSQDHVSENNATEAYAGISAGVWSGTAAISSIKIPLSSGNFVQYSTASLYKITAD